jgi:hypothetical protein
MNLPQPIYIENGARSAGVQQHTGVLAIYTDIYKNMETIVPNIGDVQLYFRFFPSGHRVLPSMVKVKKGGYKSALSV